MDFPAMSQYLEKNGVNIDPSLEPKLALYATLLAIWNERMNLTAITDPKAVYELHFLDCLLALKGIDIKGKSVCDIGSGAGFPGMVFALFEPSAQVTLVDSTKKKFTFLQDIKEKLGVDNVTFHIGRVEDMREQRDEFDLVCARGFAALPVFLEVAAPLAKKGGLLLAMKGKKADEELGASKKAIDKLGLQLFKDEELILPDSGETRRELFFEKKHPTPIKYPRPWKDIIAKPL